MNIKLADFVKNSDFKHYKFVIVAKSVKNKHFTCEIKHRQNCVGILNIDFNNPMEGEVNYDITQNWDLLTDKADIVAYYIDKCKIFKFDFAEHCGETLYIHLLLK